MERRRWMWRRRRRRRLWGEEEEEEKREESRSMVGVVALVGQWIATVRERVATSNLAQRPFDFSFGQY